MSRLPLFLILLLPVVLLASDPPRALPPVTIGKDTTVIHGPVQKDGLLDYEAALNEKLKGKATAKTNAVVLLMQAIGPKPEGSDLHADYYKQLGMDPPPPNGPYLIRQGEFFEQEIRGDDAQAFWDREGELRTRPWTAKEEPKIAEWLDANARPLAVVAEASQRPDYFHPMIARNPDGSRPPMLLCLLSTTQRCREMAHLLSLRIMLSCGEKKYDDAWKDILTLHRLGRQVGKGSCLIELLVGIAIDAIAQNQAIRFLEARKPNAKQALAYLDDLRKLPPFPTLAEKLDVMDRYTVLDCAQHLRRDGFVVLNGFLDRPIPDVTPDMVQATFAKLNWDRSLRTVNKWVDQQVAAVSEPTRLERLKALEQLKKELDRTGEKARDFAAIAADVSGANRAAGSERFGDLLAILLLPHVNKVNESNDRRTLHYDIELLAFALAAYHADEKKYPAKLTDLMPKYAREIPVDLYNRKPLIYKLNEKGYELYSVWMNERDDGGHLLSDDPPGQDLGIRMPAQRKKWEVQPAPPAGLPFPPGAGPKK